MRDVLEHRPNRESPLDALAECAGDVLTDGWTSTGRAALCCVPVPGSAFAAARERVTVLTAPTADLLHWEWDVHGDVWAVIAAPGLRRLAQALGRADQVLQRRGFGGQQRWAVVGLCDAESRRAFIVYDYQRRTFSPFAPVEGVTRDECVEKRLAHTLAGRLPLAAEPASWPALWDMPPGLATD